jgi:crotonobetainyl-CoA:carnitine CoA-transferase CaiB-like acyl-CoA transferase
VSPVNPVGRALEHPLTAERRILLEPAGAPAGEKLVRLPFEAAGTVPRWPAKVGAHTEEVLAAAGVPADQIAQILGRGSPAGAAGQEEPAAGPDAARWSAAP